MQAGWSAAVNRPATNVTDNTNNSFVKLFVRHTFSPPPQLYVNELTTYKQRRGGDSSVVRAPDS